jgi:hypothetical protein
VCELGDFERQALAGKPAVAAGAAREILEPAASSFGIEAIDLPGFQPSAVR